MCPFGSKESVAPVGMNSLDSQRNTFSLLPKKHILLTPFVGSNLRGKKSSQGNSENDILTPPFAILAISVASRYRRMSSLCWE